MEGGGGVSRGGDDASAGVREAAMHLKESL